MSAPTLPSATSTSGCTASIPTCGRGTSRGTSRGSTSTAGPRGSSGSVSCRTRVAPCSGATSTATASGSASTRAGCAYDDFDLTDGFAYDRWGLRFGWRPGAPAATFHFDGVARTVSGPDAGALTPLSVSLDATPTTERFGTGTGDDVGNDAYPASRFEQSLAVAGHRHRGRTGATRAGRRSPRPVVGAAQLAGRVHPRRPPVGARAALLRRRAAAGRARWGLRARRVRCPAHCAASTARSTTTTTARTIAPTRLRFADEAGAPLDVELDPISPSVSFDMAHTCEEPEHWLYWRILVAVRVSGWPEPVRGWVEASRYGCT